VVARDHQVFLGKLDPAGLDFGERLTVKIVHAPAGDFRDWAVIRAWGREVAAELRSASAVVNAGTRGA
jgi:menaquinone-dependent protoporphyrinogen oxidase